MSLKGRPSLKRKEVLTYKKGRIVLKEKKRCLSLWMEQNGCLEAELSGPKRQVVLMEKKWKFIAGLLGKYTDISVIDSYELN